MAKFLFIHIPKTGGVSLNTYAKNVGLDWYIDPTKKNNDGRPLYHETFSEKLVEKLNPDFLLTSLRCPIEQTKSMWSYLKIVREGKPGFVKMQPFSEWLRNPYDGIYGYQWGNLSPNNYVCFFGNGNPDIEVGPYVDGNFDVAVENLKRFQIFDFNHLTKQFNDFIFKFSNKEFDLKLNKSESNFEISKDDVSYIKKIREQDIELCKMFNIKITGD